MPHTGSGDGHISDDTIEDEEGHASFRQKREKDTFEPVMGKIM